jgi:hypothetical protein
LETHVFIGIPSEKVKGILRNLFLFYSTFANGEVKEFKEVREVKAICFTAKYSTKKAVGYNF